MARTRFKSRKTLNKLDMSELVEYINELEAEANAESVQQSDIYQKHLNNLAVAKNVQQRRYFEEGHAV